VIAACQAKPRLPPGIRTGRIARSEFGFSGERAAFRMQFGHGPGLCPHERPIIIRLCSFEHSLEIKTGMVFARKAYGAAIDGFSAAQVRRGSPGRRPGHTVITLPAEELPIANA
jgi:hypothetical protein